MKHKVIFIHHTTDVGGEFRVQAIYKSDNRLIAVAAHFIDPKAKAGFTSDIVEIDTPASLPIELHILDEVSLIQTIELFNQQHERVFQAPETPTKNNDQKRHRRTDSKKLIALNAETFTPPQNKAADESTPKLADMLIKYVEHELGENADLYELALSANLTTANMGGFLTLLNKPGVNNMLRLFINTEHLSAEERQVVTKQILQQTHTTDCVIQGISANVQEQITAHCANNTKLGEDHFSPLLKEMKLSIFSLLKPSDLNSAIRVNRETGLLSTDENFWRQKLMRDFFVYRDLSPHAVINYQKKYEISYQHTSKTLDESTGHIDEDAELFAEVRAGDLMSPRKNGHSTKQHFAFQNILGFGSQV